MGILPTWRMSQNFPTYCKSMVRFAEDGTLRVGGIGGGWRRWLAEKERLQRCYKSRDPPIHTVPCSHGGRTEGR